MELGKSYGHFNEDLRIIKKISVTPNFIKTCSNPKQGISDFEEKLTVSKNNINSTINQNKSKNKIQETGKFFNFLIKIFRSKLRRDRLSQIRTT